MPKCWSRVSRKQVKAVRQQQSCYEKKKKWWWIWHHDYPSLHTHTYIYVRVPVGLFKYICFFKWDISHGAPYKGNTTAWCTVLLHLQLAMKMSFLCFNVRKNIVPRKLLFVVSFHDFIVVDFPIWCTQKHFYTKWNWTKQSFHYFNDNFLLSERGFFFFFVWIVSLQKSGWKCWWYNAIFPMWNTCFCLDTHFPVWCDTRELSQLGSKFFWVFYICLAN